MSRIPNTPSGSAECPLRLIADDLTGALDCAAQFARTKTPVPVFLKERLPAVAPDELAIDSGSRNLDPKAAESLARKLASFIEPAGPRLAFRKIDSLLRGNPANEIAGTLRALSSVDYCVIAPAFPLQGRITKGGRQFVRRGKSEVGVGCDLAVELKALGFETKKGVHGKKFPRGISIWDATCDPDLEKIVDFGRRLAGRSVLWCGSGGLAFALAGKHAPILNPIAPPILGIFGSNHPVTVAQLGMCADLLVKFGNTADSLAINEKIDRHGVCLTQFDLPDTISADGAALRIRGLLTVLVGSIRPPGVVIAAGGETLRSLCLALDIEHLNVLGQIMPGVPVSQIVGGPWTGVSVVSKSGAFGENHLLASLLSANAKYRI